MTEQTVLVAQADGVQTITLNRPDKLNAANEAMCRALQAALTAAAADSVRVVLLSGAGKAFCAGQDLSERVRRAGEPPPDLGQSLERNWNPIARAIRALPKPVICAVNGVAAGAGCNLALACDIVLAARSAKFVQPFARLGLVPDVGGTHNLPRLLGLARAKAVALLGETIDAEQAASWGLIWKVLDDDKLVAESGKLAAHFASAPTYGLGLIKQALHASASNSFEAQLDLERDLQRLAGRAPDYAEGVRAFMEKRPPNFTGRKD